MRYCAHCGAEVHDEAVMCPSCYCKLSNGVSSVGASNAQNNVMAMVGFILSLVTMVLYKSLAASVVALVLSIIGFKQIKRTGEQGKAFAIAGIVISSVALASVLLAYVLIFGYYGLMLSIIFGAAYA